MLLVLSHNYCKCSILFCSVIFYPFPCYCICHCAAHAGIAVHPSHPCELHDKVRWSSLTSRRHQHTDLLIYKVTLSELPTYLTSLVGFNVKNHKKNIITGSVFSEIFSYQLEQGEAGFQFHASYYWNELKRKLKLGALH